MIKSNYVITYPTAVRAWLLAGWPLALWELSTGGGRGSGPLAWCQCGHGPPVLRPLPLAAVRRRRLCSGGAGVSPGSWPRPERPGPGDGDMLPVSPWPPPAQVQVGDPDALRLTQPRSSRDLGGPAAGGLTASHVTSEAAPGPHRPLEHCDSGSESLAPGPGLRLQRRRAPPAFSRKQTPNYSELLIQFFKLIILNYPYYATRKSFQEIFHHIC